MNRCPLEHPLMVGVYHIWPATSHLGATRTNRLPTVPTMSAGGDLIVSEDEIYAMRERMRAVEVQIRYMSDEMKEFRGEVKDLGASIRSLTNLVSQAKGARYVIGLGFMALGALATFAPTLVKMLFAVQ